MVITTALINLMIYLIYDLKVNIKKNWEIISQFFVCTTMNNFERK